MHAAVVTDPPAAAAPLTRGALAHATPAEVRAAIREGRWTGVTHGMARGHLQANLAIVPKAHAFDFLRFCLANPKPCPLVEVLDAGDPVPRRCARGADLRTDLSKPACSATACWSTRCRTCAATGATTTSPS